MFVQVEVCGASSCEGIMFRMSDMHLRACGMSCVGVTSRVLSGAGMVVGGQAEFVSAAADIDEMRIYGYVLLDNTHGIKFMISKPVVSCNQFPYTNGPPSPSWSL